MFAQPVDVLKPRWEQTNMVIDHGRSPAIGVRHGLVERGGRRHARSGISRDISSIGQPEMDGFVRSHTQKLAANGLNLISNPPNYVDMPNSDSFTSHCLNLGLGAVERDEALDALELLGDAHPDSWPQYPRRGCSASSERNVPRFAWRA